MVLEKTEFGGTLFMWLGAILSLILAFLVIHFKINPTSEAMPLHYSVVVGVDALGSGNQLYRIPAFGLGLVVLNFILASFVKSPKSFLSYLAALVSLVISLILLLGTIFLLRVA